MPKRRLGIDVDTAARQRIEWSFDNFERLYVSFSGGKDSTVMLHMVADVARKRGRKIGILIVDLEGQYKYTIEHISRCVDMYSDIADVHWVCLPLHLRNAVSVYQPFWMCWDPEARKQWVREFPPKCINDEAFFPFFGRGMEFEEFVPLFGEWYAQGQSCACFVGIRTDESLNRFRALSSEAKETLDGVMYTTRVTEHTYNVYPIYDWKTEDIWTYHGKNHEKPYNMLYDLMYKAGLSIHQSRICQPYGDDQRRGLWLFHIIEPETWGRVVARVNGANTGAMYIQETGNMTGYRKIGLPPGHTWRSFADMLINSLPDQAREHFRIKIDIFRRWWMARGYPDGIPDEAEQHLETQCKVPSWRRVCKALLRNDYWCKGLGFSQQKSHAYWRYLDRMKTKRAEWALDTVDPMDASAIQLDMGMEV